MTSQASPPPIYALTPGRLTGDGPGLTSLVEDVRNATRAGLRAVLVREPGLTDRAFLGLTRAIVDIVGEVDGWVGVHDRPHLARLTGASGVHLGFRSLAPRDAREVVGGDLAIGLSTHADDDPAPIEGVDHVFFGPVRPTPSKEGILDAVGLEALHRRCEQSPVGVWAIGGLRPIDVRACLDAGARGLAVLGGLLGSPSPAESTGAYLEEVSRWS